MMMKILLITIISEKVGIGHFQRCVNLSNNYKKNFCDTMILAITDKQDVRLVNQKKIKFLKNKYDIDNKNILNFIKKTDVLICDASNNHLIEKVLFFISAVNKYLPNKIKKIIYPAGLKRDKIIESNSKYFDL